jgi:hypothetical protein
MRLASLLLLAGCSSGTITAAAFPAAFGAAVCNQQARCRAEAHFLEQSCEGDASSVYSADLAKALAKGTSHFNAQAAQKCLDGLNARPCDRTPPDVDQACEQAVTGTVAAGSSCNWIYECQQGRCEPSGPGGCPATCGTVAELGATCDVPCDLRAGLRCIDNVCSTLHALDQKCSSSADCAVGLYCDGFSKCSTPSFELAVCDANEQCASGLFCDLSANGGLCKKRFQTGQACTATSADAITFACVDGDLCRGFNFTKTQVTAGVCQPLGEIGASCVAGVLVTGCGAGLRCAGGACADKPTSGPCAQDSDCKDGVAYCDGANCQLLKDDGATCTRSQECSSLACDSTSGVCVDTSSFCHEP